MKSLLVSHASRPFVEARATLNALELRFSSPTRLTNLPPLDSLPSVQAAIPYSGMLTIWDVDDPAQKKPALIGEYAPNYKIQFATFRGNQLLVLGGDRLEVLTPGFILEKTIRDTWLVGGHTVHCDKDGFAYVTSAPANAILKIDIDAGKIVERILLPNNYGIGYPLTEADDLHRHFIPTDLQPTHINSAVPCPEGILVTLCAQGIVGAFDTNKKFREIITGYRGCHGARINFATGSLYFTDSTAGIIWFADYQTGRILSRLKINSAWIHDTDQIDQKIFAVSLSDHNRIEIVSGIDGSVITTLDCHPFGASTMFVKAATLPDSWHSTAPRDSVSTTKEQPIFGNELLADPLNRTAWSNVASVSANVDTSLHITTSNDVRYEYLAEGQKLKVQRGDYVFQANLECKVGEATVGILDENHSWIAILPFDASNLLRHTKITLKKSQYIRFCIAANNSRRPCPVKAELRSLSLKKIHTP